MCCIYGGGCYNTEGVYDYFEEDCSYYEQYPDQCGNYDDDDFISTEACCVCKTGSENDDDDSSEEECNNDYDSSGEVNSEGNGC